MVEMTVGVVVMTLVLGSAFSVLFQSEKLFSGLMRQFVADQTGQRLMDRFAEELCAAEPKTILPLLLDDSDHIVFQKVTGFAGAVPTLGLPRSFTFHLAPGEVKNGKDDNGDRLIDEGFVDFTELSSPPIRLAEGVQALRFSSAPNGLALSVDLALKDDKGNVSVKTFNLRICFRNPA